MKRIAQTLQAGFCFLAFLPPALQAAPAPPGNSPAQTRIDTVRVAPLWLKDGKGPVQPVTVTISQSGPGTNGVFFFGRFDAGHFTLRAGQQNVELRLPASEKPAHAALRWEADGKVLAETNLSLVPPRLREIWVLPHSHVDIGYTDRQERVAQLQVSNLITGMELARSSAGNAAGERFKWNVEAAWTVDNFLQQATPEQRGQFIQAVRSGQVDVDAIYANLLTGLCRPEELAQSFAFGARLSDITGNPVETAMICDVPGYTWGIVPMLAQAGVKYFAMGPNGSARIGTIHRWDNTPFYWKSQSGTDRILCWMVDYYHHNGDLESQVLALNARLTQADFRYDMAYMMWVGRWPNGGLDNSPPDAQLTQKAQAWNAKYAVPRIVIGLEKEFFAEFEKRHSAQIPAYGGDITPYWEDGAGSTAHETALNRATGDRLAQASTLFAMRAPELYPAARFNQAWKDAMLYSEHTWGAYCSISQPDNSFTLDQWKVKQNFALQASMASHELLAAALPRHDDPATTIDVFNTTQWPRTAVAVLQQDLSGETTAVLDENGREIPSQRLISDERVFLAKDVPAFGVKRYHLGAAQLAPARGAHARGNVLETHNLRVEVNPVTGAVKSLRLAGLDHEFVDPNAPVGLNDFRYVLGTDTVAAKSNGPVKIVILEDGPIMAALRIDCDAPGCNHLTREVWVVDGLDQVEFVDHVDRKTVRDKDAVHFGFGLDVPNSVLRLETPWAVVRPNADQLPGSCRNWFTVQRWADLSGPDYGIGWASLDAPLIEIGAMTANLLGESLPPAAWMTQALESKTIYSWAQNNHWFTNYKIDQPGVTTFHYILRPHQGGYSPVDSARFGLETTRPFIVVGADAAQPAIKPLLSLSPPSVIAETVKMSDDGKALILRLHNVSSETTPVRVDWGSLKPGAIWITDLAERQSKRVTAPLEIAGNGVLSLRAEVPMQLQPKQEVTAICSLPAPAH